jgi:hypothetical protein
MQKTALAEKNIAHSSSVDNKEDNTEKKLPSMRKIVGAKGLRKMVDAGVEFLQEERKKGNYNPNY